MHCSIPNLAGAPEPRYHDRRCNANRRPPLALCILCSSPLPSDNKPEHVWLASLGGRKTNRQTLCSKCNGDMGSGPDKALAESVAVIRNLLNLESGRGDPPPAIKGLRHGEDRIALKPGGIPVIDGGRPFEITWLPNGNPSVELRVTSPEHLRKVLPDLARALRMPLADVKASLRSGQVRHVSQRIGTQSQKIELGGPWAMRSMLKTCLTLWAVRHGGDELQKPIYDVARRFVRYGGDDLACAICQIDFGPLAGADTLVPRFGQHFNLALVASDQAGRAVGYFRLYNACAWRFELCTQGASASSIVTYVSNPEQPNNWETAVTDELIPAVAVLETIPSHDYTEVRAAFGRMHADYHSRASIREIDKICEQASTKLGFPPDQPLTPEQIERYTAVVLHRMANWMVGLPFEESLRAEEIARFLDEAD